MKPYLIDSHCHLHFPSYETDLPEVMQRMREQRIAGITIGTLLGNSARGIAFAEQHDQVWATVGLHPEHVTSDYLDEQEGAEKEHELDQAKLLKLAQSSKKVVAIGETGLDYYRIDEGRDREQAMKKQEEVLLGHFAVAQQLDLPLVFHVRDALPRLAELLQVQWNQGYQPRGVVHSFTGTWEEAKPLLDLGLCIAVNGISTFPPRKGQDPATAIDRTIERIPLDRLLVETDAPYLAPVPMRGKRNEPVYVRHVAEHVAVVRHESLDRIAEQTTENASQLFRLGF